MKRLLVYLFAVSMLVLVSVPATGAARTTMTANTYYVSTDGEDSHTGLLGSPWRTIAYAINHVPDDGSNVIVNDGTYDECVVIKRGFDHSLHIQAAHPYKARWQCSQQSEVIEFLSSARNITIEGFEIARPNSSASGRRLVAMWVGHNIILRDNIFHDSYNDDLMIIGYHTSDILVENNMFYNQEGGDEHIDVNGAVDVVIQDNIFFNDFAGSGRTNHNDTSSYIVIKDSTGTNYDGIIGAQRISVRRNVFLNWEGKDKHFVLVGEDGRYTYFEAIDVTIENNLMLGNSSNEIQSPIAVRGSKDITVRANTIVGDLPAQYFGIASFIVGDNPKNENVNIHNNIWSDPTGTMGEDFSCCSSYQTKSYTFDNNLFFNAEHSFPTSYNPFVEISDDAHRVIGDPELGDQSGDITVPRWNGTNFNGGYATIREAFEGLVDQYGILDVGSAAIDAADPANMPADDILGHNRSDIDTTPDIGAYESEVYGFKLTPRPVFQYIDPGESASYVIGADPGVFTGTVSLSVGDAPQDILMSFEPMTVPLPGSASLILTSTHTISPLIPGAFVQVPITATGGGFTRTTTASLLVGGARIYLPIIFKDA